MNSINNFTKCSFSIGVIGICILIISVYPIHAQNQPVWIQSHNGSANLFDEPIKMLQDNEGNIIVTGYESPDSSSFRIVTIKYNSSNGFVLWKNVYSGGLHFDAKPSAMAIDEFNNIYITGSTGPFGTDSMSIVTIKYQSNGVLSWKKYYDTTYSDVPSDIVVDANGNIIITGTSLFSCITIKYNSTGALLWTAYYTDSLNINGVRIRTASDGSVYVGATSCYNIDLCDMIVIKYNSDGQQQWIRTYNGPASTIDILTDMEIDPQGNVLVAGSSEAEHDGFVDNDYCLIKYSTAGAMMWEYRYDGGWGGDYPIDLILDSVGNNYLTGWSIDNLDSAFSFIKSVRTIKINANGQQQWVAQYRGNNYYFNTPSAISIGTNGFIYVTGLTEISLEDGAMLVLRYDKDGVQKNAFTFNPGTAEDFVKSFAVEANGDFYLSGVTFTDTSYWDWLTIKFHTDITSVKPPKEMPTYFELYQNYPNPFNPVTTIEYHLPISCYVLLRVYDILGREVATLVNEEKISGDHKVVFDAALLPTGVYYYRIQAGNYVETRKLLLLK